MVHSKKKKIFKIFLIIKLKKMELRDTLVLKYQGNRRNQKGRLACEKRTEREDSQKWCPRN